MRQNPTVTIYYDGDMLIREDILPGRLRTATLLDPKTEALVRKYLPTGSALEDMAAVFAAFADPGRLKIISALSVTEMCVGDLSAVLDINQTTLSHQLRTLRDAGIVAYKKQGKVVFYSLSCPLILDFMLTAAKLGRKQPVFAE